MEDGNMMEHVLSLQTWKRFVKEGVLDSSRLHKRIIESWYRCKDTYLNPYLEKGTQILSYPLLQSQKEKSSLFLELATPHLNELYQSVEDLGMIALFIDAEGYVLSISGNKEVLQEARKINFVEGVKWTETEVGTNAIGTALQIKEPIMVNGTEHYSILSHSWCCAAAPLFYDDGSLMGVLDVSSPLERSHPYMLAMVVSAAYKMEREVRNRMNKDEIELIQQCMDILESQRDILICTTKQVIVGASKSIRHAIPKLYTLRVYEMKDYGYSVQMEVPVCSKVHGRVIGTYLYLSKHDIESSFQTLESNHGKQFHFRGEIGTSYSFRKMLNKLKRVATTEISVTILGETGTGKEVIAQSIHLNSLRKDGPFVAVNCGAIPKELIASELFGYVEGAFTGARRQGYKGKFEQAHNGTLFLDEVGELPQSMQVALLRVLQERKVTPIGSSKEIPLNIRIIAATHRDLRQLVEEEKFREDLFYRLYVFPIKVPTLRERKEDIPHLVRYFYEGHHRKMKLSYSFFQKLMEYDWPGNIRELFNYLERLYVLYGDEVPEMITVDNILETSYPAKPNELESMPYEIEVTSTELTSRQSVQREMMIDALRKSNGNVSTAARILGVPRSTFYKRLKKYQL